MELANLVTIYPQKKNLANVGKYTSPMDPSWEMKGFIFQLSIFVENVQGSSLSPLDSAIFRKKR